MMSERNIYLITRKGDYTYDEYIGHIVIADNPYKAREICPSGDEGFIWTRSEEAECKYIGKSKLKPQVVLSSFNAG